MKRIILLVLTFVIGFLSFNIVAKALNSDATATCVYTFPSNDFYSGVTLTYSGGEVESNCHLALKTTTEFKHSCEVEVLSVYFINDISDNMECPKLYYYYKLTNAFDVWADGNFNDFLNSDLSNHIFKVLDQSSYRDLSKTQLKKATISELYPAAGSSVNQGSTPLTEAEEISYLQCKCGDVLIKDGEVLFSDSVLKWYTPNYTLGFDPTKLTSCPDGLYYKSHAGSRTIDISNQNFEKAKALGCASTADIKKYANSTKNPIKYSPIADVILPFCQETSKIWKMVGYLVGALKILVPVIIIVFGSIDLGKAVVAQSEDDIKKSTKVLIMRVIAGIIIFFIPTVINLVFKMVSKYSNSAGIDSACVECVTKPGNC